MDRIFEAIEDIQSKEFEFWLRTDQNITQIVNYFLIKKSYNLKIEKNSKDLEVFSVATERL